MSEAAATQDMPNARPDRAELARDLRQILPDDAVLDSREACVVYECDGLVVDLLPWCAYRRPIWGG